MGQINISEFDHSNTANSGILENNHGQNIVQNMKILEEPLRPKPQEDQINMGMNKSEFDLSNTTNNENLENSHVQNIIQYNEDKQLSDTNEQIDKNICNSELLNSNFSGGMIVIENPSQPKTHLQNQNDNGINNNEFNSTNTAKSDALETINLQDLLQYSELSQLPTTISHKNNITFDSDYLNQMLQNHTLHQSLQGESNTQLSLQQIQNEKHGESCEMISIVSQGVNTKGHMTVNLENTQNRIYNNVEDIKPVTSRKKRKRKYEEEPYEDEEEEKKRLGAKKAYNYREKKKEELRLKDAEIKRFQEALEKSERELEKSEREKFAYMDEITQLK